jgi:hypothetical protein
MDGADGRRMMRRRRRRRRRRRSGVVEMETLVDAFLGLI